VRHHPHDVAPLIEDSGDIAQGTVGIIEIAEGDAVFGLELVERAIVGIVAAFAVGDGHAQDLAGLNGGSKDGVAGGGL